jgi:3'-phosphoadenosine 5'-phosphosulfate sulfotransferase (PAPS reductase)/FAD synthetase
MSRTAPTSAFTELGMRRTVELLLEEIQALYQADAIPWVVGFSGGKDSTAVLHLPRLLRRRGRRRRLGAFPDRRPGGTGSPDR